MVRPGRRIAGAIDRAATGPLRARFGLGNGPAMPG